MVVAALDESSMNTVVKIELARKFGVERWLLPAYVSIALRDAPLSQDEANCLGYDFVLRISRVREKVLRARLTTPSGSFGRANGQRGMCVCV